MTSPPLDFSGPISLYNASLLLSPTYTSDAYLAFIYLILLITNLLTLSFI